MVCYILEYANLSIIFVISIAILFFIVIAFVFTKITFKITIFSLFIL